MADKLNDGILNRVSGGAGGANAIQYCSYTCPLCGKTHTLEITMSGLNRYVTAHTACGLTREIQIHTDVGSMMYVYDHNGNQHSVYYHTDKVIVDGKEYIP